MWAKPRLIWSAVLFLAVGSLALILFLRSERFDRVHDEIGVEPEVMTNNSRPTPEKTVHVDRQGEVLHQLDAIGFADGGELRITWRKRPRPTGIPGDSPRDFSVLSEMARGGDLYAPVILYDMVKACERAPVDESALQQQISRVQQTQRVRSSTDGNDVYVDDPEIVRQVVQQMGDSFDRCHALTAEQRRNPDKWLELAVANGNTVAMIDLANQINDPARSSALHEQAWQHGDSFGLFGMYEAKMEAYESGIDPAGMITAYATFIAFSVLTEERYRATGSRAAERGAEKVRADLEQKMKELRPNELTRAFDAAREIINSNPNCCLSLL